VNLRCSTTQPNVQKDVHINNLPEFSRLLDGG
jgi:hypothetical protein